METLTKPSAKKQKKKTKERRKEKKKKGKATSHLGFHATKTWKWAGT